MLVQCYTTTIQAKLSRTTGDLPKFNMIFTERAHNEHMSVCVHGSYTALTRLMFFYPKARINTGVCQVY